MYGSSHFIILVQPRWLSKIWPSILWSLGLVTLLNVNFGQSIKHWGIFSSGECLPFPGLTQSRVAGQCMGRRHCPVVPHFPDHAAFEHAHCLALLCTGVYPAFQLALGNSAILLKHESRADRCGNECSSWIDPWFCQDQGIFDKCVSL